MARRLLYLFVASSFLFPAAAQAQRGQQVFDFVLQEAQRELLRQEEIQRQRELERAQRHQDLSRLQQQFAALRQACLRGDVATCDHALSFPNLTSQDRNLLQWQRSAIIDARQAAAEQARRAHEEAIARERQREEAERQRKIAEVAQHTQEKVAERVREITRQREETKQHRQLAEQAERERVAMAAQMLVLRQEQERATVMTWVAAGGAFASVSLALVLLLARSARNSPGPQTPGLRDRWLTRMGLRRRSASPPLARVEPALSTTAPEHTATVPEPSFPRPLAPPRDTAGAIAALELAFAYIVEVRDAPTPAHDDTLARKERLNTLSLATKQLCLARTLDPDAVLESADGDGDSLRFTQSELEAEALLLEGITHQFYDLRRAIPALVRATRLNPNGPRAFYVLGLVHAANRSKKDALAAFERAVALDPKNLTYRKELNRVQNLSGAEIAAYKATRAGERTVDAGVLTWNIFAFVWNIVMFPLRVVVGTLRLLRLTGFH